MRCMAFIRASVAVAVVGGVSIPAARALEPRIPPDAARGIANWIYEDAIRPIGKAVGKAFEKPDRAPEPHPAPPTGKPAAARTEKSREHAVSHALHRPIEKLVVPCIPGDPHRDDCLLRQPAKPAPAFKTPR